MAAGKPPSNLGTGNYKAASIPGTDVEGEGEQLVTWWESMAVPVPTRVVHRKWLLTKGFQALCRACEQCHDTSGLKPPP